MIRHRSFAALSLGLVIAPFIVLSVLRTGVLRQRDLLADIDPFEVNMQLLERND